MWIGDSVYFASDRDGKLNLYRIDPASGETEQVTHHTDYDVRRPTSDGSRVVYELGGTLWVYDPAVGESHQLAISIRPDAPEARPYIEDVSDELQGGNPLADRRAGRGGRAGRDLLGAEGARADAQPEPQLGRPRPVPGLVAGRTVARLSVRRRRRVPDLAGRRAGRRAGEADRSAARLPAHSALVAGQLEDRFRRHDPALLLPRRGEWRGGGGRPGDPGADGHRHRPEADPRLPVVSRQPLSDLLEDQRRAGVAGGSTLWRTAPAIA